MREKKRQQEQKGRRGVLVETEEENHFKRKTIPLFCALHGVVFFYVCPFRQPQTQKKLCTMHTK
jgi:hypothetical protein